MAKRDRAIREIENGIMDLILDNDIEITVKHDDKNEYVDFEIGRSSGYRRALQVVHRVMKEYGISRF